MIEPHAKESDIYYSVVDRMFIIPGHIIRHKIGDNF